MTRQATGDDEDGVDADGVTGFGKARGKSFGGGRDPAQAVGIERHRCCIFASALLDLYKRNGAATAGDQVDFPARDPGTPREDSPAAQPEPPRRDRFGAATARFGGLAGQSLAPNSSARA